MKIALFCLIALIAPTAMAGSTGHVPTVVSDDIMKKDGDVWTPFGTFSLEELVNTKTNRSGLGDDTNPSGNTSNSTKNAGTNNPGGK